MTVEVQSRVSQALSFHAKFLTVTLTLGMVLGALFLTFPGIDLAVARSVRTVCASNAGVENWCSNKGLQPFRNSFIWFSIVVTALAAYGLCRGKLSHRIVCGVPAIGRVGWLFLLVNFAVGVGLVVNVVFKDQWGRARPHQVVEFGGSKVFTPPLIPAGQCARNCSFVSGEAAAVFAPFFGAAVLMPQYGMPLVVAGIVAGGASGAVRMLSGRHFLSDVVFSGIFTALTALGLHALFFGRLIARLSHRSTRDQTYYPHGIAAWWHQVHAPLPLAQAPLPAGATGPSS